MTKLLITRNLPQEVLEAAKAVADVTVREDQSPMSAQEAAEMLQAYDVILPTLGDQFISL